MVPAWTLILLTVAFFIRETIIKHSEKKKEQLYYKYFGDNQNIEYQNGYFYAYKEIADVWNSDIKGGKNHDIRLHNLGVCITKGLNRKWSE